MLVLKRTFRTKQDNSRKQVNSRKQDSSSQKDRSNKQDSSTKQNSSSKQGCSFNLKNVDPGFLGENFSELYNSKYACNENTQAAREHAK